MKKLAVGDIFCSALGNGKKCFFQYIANDSSQLNGNVIRVFSTKYNKSDEPEIHEIVNDSVDFHALVVLSLGLKLKHWQKIGNSKYIKNLEFFFRNSSDYGFSQEPVSHNWWVWKVDSEHLFVGKLEKNFQTADIGIIVTPEDIITRMETGRYDFSYPSF